MPGLKNKIILEMNVLRTKMGLLDGLMTEAVQEFGEQKVCNNPEFQEIMSKFGAQYKPFNKGISDNIVSVREWFKDQKPNTIQRTRAEIEELAYKLLILDVLGQAGATVVGNAAVVKDPKAQVLEKTLTNICYPFLHSLDDAIDELKSWIDAKLKEKA